MVKLMKRVLLIGDNELAQYHPFNAVRKLLCAIVKPYCHLEISDRIDIFSKDYEDNNVLIIYSDRFDLELKDQEVEKLVNYVKSGGALLVLHNGISLADHPVLKDLIGGAFMRHPEAELLSYTLTKPLETSSIKAFNIYEEPYQFEFAENVERETILSYAYKSQTFSAGWIRKYGSGQVIYLQPGHNSQVFESQKYQQLVIGYLKTLIK